MKKVTINVKISSDASFDLKSKTGAYAFIITCPLFKATMSGRFKHPVTSSSDAEGKAILNAIFFIKDAIMPLAYIEQVDVWCDNTVVKTIFQRTKPEKQKDKDKLGSRLRAQLANILGQEKLDIQWNWLKGHNKNPQTEEDFENDECDKLATKAVAGKFTKTIQNISLTEEQFFQIKNKFFK